MAGTVIAVMEALKSISFIQVNLQFDQEQLKEKVVIYMSLINILP